MSLRATSISEIKSNILRPSTTSSFLAFIPFPNNFEVRSRLSGLLGASQEKLILGCCECSLPGSSFITSKQDNDRTGVTETHAYRRSYEPLALTFYVDAEEYLSIKFFELWMNHIAGEDIGGKNVSENNFSYRFRYPNDYVADQGLSILKFEKDIVTQVKRPNILEDIVNIIAGTDFGSVQNKRTGSSAQYNFFRAFPISINSMPLSYEASRVLKVTVNFSYTRYTLDSVNISGDSLSSPSQVIANQRGFERELDIATGGSNPIPGTFSAGLSGAGTIRELDRINRGTSGVPVTPPGFGGIA